jgi:hypothetical protein
MWPPKPSLFALGILAPLLSGCMAMGMHGTMHHGSSHQDHRERQSHAPLVEEMRAGQVSVVLEVPPLTAGEEAILSVKLSDSRHGTPLSGARVAFLIQQAGHPGAPAHTAHEAFEYRTAEAGEKGTYQLKHVFAEAGVYEVTAQVWLSGTDETVSPLTIAATREVGREEHGGHSPGMWPVGMLGGVGMVLMMGVMMGGLLF